MIPHIPHHKVEMVARASIIPESDYEKLLKISGMQRKPSCATIKSTLFAVGGTQRREHW